MNQQIDQIFQKKQQFQEEVRRGNVQNLINQKRIKFQLSQLNAQLNQQIDNIFEDLINYTKELLCLDIQQNYQKIENIITNVRKLTSYGPNIPIKEIILSQFGQCILKFLGYEYDNYQNIQHQSCWIIANLLSGDKVDQNYFINQNLIIILLRLLDSTSSEIVNDVIFCLTNLIIENNKISIYLVQSSTFQHILYLFKIGKMGNYIEDFKNLLWMISQVLYQNINIPSSILQDIQSIILLGLSCNQNSNISLIDNHHTLQAKFEIYNEIMNYSLNCCYYLVLIDAKFLQQSNFVDEILYVLKTSEQFTHKISIYEILKIILKSKILSKDYLHQCQFEILCLENIQDSSFLLRKAVIKSLFYYLINYMSSEEIEEFKNSFLFSKIISLGIFDNYVVRIQVLKFLKQYLQLINFSQKIQFVQYFNCKELIINPIVEEQVDSKLKLLCISIVKTMIDSYQKIMNLNPIIYNTQETMIQQYCEIFYNNQIRKQFLNESSFLF